MRNRRRGVALLVTLLILAVVIILTAQLSSATRTSAVLSANYVAELQNYHALRAGVNYAVMTLRTDKAKGTAEDTLHETWAAPFDPITLGDAQVSFRIEDEERRLSARNLTIKVQEQGKPVEKPNPKARDRINRLSQLLGLPIENLGQRIIDYQDADKEGEFEDADDDFPLGSFGELLLVNGVTESILYGKGGKTPQEQGLQPWLTVWGTGAVNINTAPLEDLMSLDPKISKTDAEKIIQYRDSKKTDGTYVSFAQVDKAVLVNDVHLSDEVADILVAVAKEGWLGMSSTHFSVYLRARSGGFESRARVILKRDGGNVTTVFWDEDQRYTKREEQR